MIVPPQIVIVGCGSIVEGGLPRQARSTTASGILPMSSPLKKIYQVTFSLRNINFINVHCTKQLKHHLIVYSLLRNEQAYTTMPFHFSKEYTSHKLL